MKNYKLIIIFTFLIVILAMSVGYSAFANQLSLEGVAEIVTDWNVKISKVEVAFVSQGCDAGTPTFTNTNVVFDAKLVKPDDIIIYEITIENAGTIDAKLENIIFMEDNSFYAIRYETSEIKKELNAGEETVFTVSVTYDEEYGSMVQGTVNTIIGFIEYAQK